MKAIIISINPHWCELIISGKKTVEIRKTRPRLETPFKCYIYCTKGSLSYPVSSGMICHNNGCMDVIGECNCNNLTYIEADFDVFGKRHLYNTAFIDNQHCLTDDELFSYLYRGNNRNNGGWAWHISDLKIYEKPKRIGEFCYPVEKYCEPGLCGGCQKGEVPGEDGDVMFGCEWKRPPSRPPQSWCYVMEVKNEK